MGGWYYNSWSYSSKHAIQTEASYPYVSASGAWNDCLADDSGIVENTGFVRVSSETEQIKAALS